MFVIDGDIPCSYPCLKLSHLFNGLCVHVRFVGFEGKEPKKIDRPQGLVLSWKLWNLEKILFTLHSHPHLGYEKTAISIINSLPMLCSWVPYQTRLRCGSSLFLFWFFFPSVLILIGFSSFHLLTSLNIELSVQG